MQTACKAAAGQLLKETTATLFDNSSIQQSHRQQSYFLFSHTTSVSVCVNRQGAAAKRIPSLHYGQNSSIVKPTRTIPFYPPV